jgi:hypothetical protein
LPDAKLIIFNRQPGKSTMLSMYLIAGILGVMLFFSVCVAPTIFKVLPQEWASVYVRNFFPKYYFVLGVLCVVAGVFAASFQLAVIAFVNALLFALSLWVLTPAINKASDTNNTKAFKVLHALSVLVNMLIMLALVYCFLLNG